jgi:hypothetical protein
MIHVLQVPKIIEDKLSKVKDLIIQCQNEGINNARDRYKIKDLYYKEDALEKELIASKEYFRKRESLKNKGN